MSERFFSGAIDSPQQVLEGLKYRKDHRETIDVSRITDLGIRWEDQGPSYGRSGYYATIDGRNMRLNETGLATANRMIKSDANHWSQYQDRNAFPRALREVLDNPGRKTPGVKIRHNGLELESIVPQDYQLWDAYDALSEFLEPAQEHIGEIKGIQVIERSNWGAHTSMRIICGNNIMPDIDPDNGQYVALHISLSECGWKPTISQLGLMRTVCTNSAFRTQTIAKWDNRAPIGKFMERTMETIRVSGYLRSQFTTIFGELLKTPLEHEAVLLLNAMKTAKMITNEHCELAELQANLPTDDGENRSVSTHYDLFNAITRGARDLPSVASRMAGEQAALDLFTSSGGLYQALRTASTKVRSREPFAFLNN